MVRAGVTRWCTTARGSNTTRLPGRRWPIRMQNSVSSHPSGISPIRPASSSKPPISSKTHRRTDMLQPHRFRTSAREVGCPW